MKMKDLFNTKCEITSFTISEHAEMRAKKRFKMNHVALTKAVIKAIDNGLSYKIGNKIYLFNDQIQFIFKSNTLVTLMPRDKPKL